VLDALRADRFLRLAALATAALTLAPFVHRVVQPACAVAARAASPATTGPWSGGLEAALVGLPFLLLSPVTAVVGLVRGGSRRSLPLLLATAAVLAAQLVGFLVHVLAIRALA
jgi:hypothetical protein